MSDTNRENDIIRSWEKYLTDGTISGVIRQQIASSWERCAQNRVNPDGGVCTRILDADQLRELQEKQRDLINIARPFMIYLYEYLRGSGYIVMLCNEQGFVIEAIGDPDILKMAERGLNFIKGACWTENEVGTNAIGTALALQRPIQVNGSEHFCLKHHSWTCSATPILDHTGKLIGILDLSGPTDKTHPHTLGMAVAAGAAITEQLMIRQKNRELTLALNNLNNIFFSMSDGVIAFNEQGIINQINPAAEQIIGKKNQEMVGSAVREILGQRTQLINNLFEKQDSFSDVEVMVDSLNGRIHCLASAKPMIDDQGYLTGGLMLIRPIRKVQNLVNRFSGAEAAFHFKDIIGRSQIMQETIRMATLAAKNQYNVLLQGESGTGKELFAHAIHNSSPRRDGPFVAVNCGAIPRDLIASELFGYEEGAFTGARRGGRPGKFELAAGGTLFLDEIGDMPLEQQVALLRVLQERKVTRIGGTKEIPVDFRIICATNKNLQKEVEAGNFRQDLYYRVNVISINIPPLREHPEDIPVLLEHFLSKTCRDGDGSRKQVDPEVLECLMRYRWPGNVRELQNVVERMVSIAEGNHLTVRDLPREIANLSPQPFPEPSAMTQVIRVTEERKKRKMAQAEKERHDIVELLDRYGGNVTRVARALGLSRNTLYRKMKQYGISI